MKPITLVLPYYDNPDMFREQQRCWLGSPRELKQWVSVVVVDDASPRFPALAEVQETGLASFELYRATKDVRWNWKFARNLGADKTKTEWLLMTDIDHIVPEETLTNLVAGDHDPQRAYLFARRRSTDMTQLEPHRNTWFLTKRMFDETGGYDERMSGLYGGDNEFWIAVHSRAVEVVTLDDYVIRVPRKHIPDASLPVSRKSRWQGWRVGRVRKRRDRDPNWKPLRLTFPYERLI
jgi:hypothetical protein